MVVLVIDMIEQKKELLNVFKFEEKKHICDKKDSLIYLHLFQRP